MTAAAADVATLLFTVVAVSAGDDGPCDGVLGVAGVGLTDRDPVVDLCGGASVEPVAPGAVSCRVAVVEAALGFSQMRSSARH